MTAREAKMKTIKTTLALTLMTAMSFAAVPAEAQQYRTHVSVNYDLLIQHSHDLEYLAEELRICFRDSFRHSPFYGKLISRTAKIKSRAASLYRNASSHGSHDWSGDIHRLEELLSLIHI